MDFDYLKKYKIQPFENPVHSTLVYNVDDSEIIKSEKNLGFLFPSEIRQFYKKVGYSKICETSSGNVDLYNQNYILPPLVAARFYEAIIDSQEKELEEPVECEGFYMSDSVVDMFEPGDLPFFEISDSSRFLYMKLHSNNPNAVWAFGNIKVEESFEKFVWRLYHEDTGFYDDIIEEYYNQNA